MKKKYDFEALHHEYQVLGIEKMIFQEEYERVVEMLKIVSERDKRITMTLGALAQISAVRIGMEYGESSIFADREEFEMAKGGMGDCSPDVAFLEDEKGIIQNTGDLIDFIPADNPVLKYAETLLE
ncbi:MAG: hypothetical protein JW754_02265 [Candidatus Aenigmarchaeota archaeon]|nr:hypothetical protein [Candidatus Aenigmarchaeota archaeon]